MDYDHPVVKNFFECSKEAAYHYRISVDETKIPPAIEARYFHALEDYRRYLDSVGIKMKRPKFPYDKNDETTHAFKDVLIKTNKKYGKFFIKEVWNPNWKYKEKYEKGFSTTGF